MWLVQKIYLTSSLLITSKNWHSIIMLLQMILKTLIVKTLIF